MLMVGVIPTKLGAAGRADERYGEFSENRKVHGGSVPPAALRYPSHTEIETRSCLPAQKNMLPNGACFELQE